MWNAHLSIWLEDLCHFTRALLVGTLNQQEYSQLPGGIKEPWLNKVVVMESLHQNVCTFFRRFPFSEPVYSYDR